MHSSSLHTVYLSIGSNQEDRLKHLQHACESLADKAGIVSRISSVYHTEAWGFNGPAFLNIAVELKTAFTPNDLWKIIAEIESENGRIRQGSGYHTRTLDIDILYYDNLIINDEVLQIPHPRMQERRFVLIPLKEIAPDRQHPLMNKTTTTLLEETTDGLSVIKLDKQVPYRHALHPDYSYIAIEGNIGAGKTTLTHMLANDYNAKTVLERFADNPFLPKFYENNERYAFPLEMSFLADRYQQLTDDLAQFDLFKSFIISDYYIFKSLIFAGVTLSEDEYALYRKIFNIMYKEITKPDLYIYLYQRTDRLLENIKKRGRDYEQKITSEYLQQVHKGYEQFIRSQENLNTLIIDVTEMDFVERPVDYWRIIQQIRKHIND